MYLDSKIVFLFIPEGLRLIAKGTLVGRVGCYWGRFIAGDWIVSEVFRSSFGRLAERYSCEARGVQVLRGGRK